MNYADIKYIDVINGDGLRVSLFVSGCSHHCQGCFNPETWDFNYGKPFTDIEQQKIISTISSTKINYSGLSILGGEPFDNIDGLLPFIEKFKSACPSKTIWIWTGYTLEYLWDLGGNYRELIQFCDVIIDGEYKERLKDLSLRFRGSRNQRIIYLRRWESRKWIND